MNNKNDIQDAVLELRTLYYVIINKLEDIAVTYNITFTACLMCLVVKLLKPLKSECGEEFLNKLIHMEMTNNEE